MRRILTFIILFSISLKNNAQFDATNLVNQVMEVQAMRELSQFRESVIKEVKTLNLSTATPEQIDAIIASYDKMKTTYNTLISQVKQDVLDFKNIKKITKSSADVATRYNETLKETKLIFNNEFIPACVEASQDRSGLLALIFPLIEKGVRFIVDAIRNHKLKKEIFLDELLNVVNIKFNGVLYLPEWNTIAISEYRKSNNLSNSISVNTVEEPIAINDPNSKVNKLKSNITIESQTGKKITPVQVEYPALKELSGSIEFVLSDSENKKMDFSLPEKYRNLIVSGKTKYSANSFVSTEVYPEGTYFQVRVKNTGFLYVFSIYDQNICYPIYPYTKEWISSFSMEPKNRNLIVGPLMLKDENGVVTVPSKNTETGEENYLHISGFRPKEELCLILSKSELSLIDLCTAIDATTGELESRVFTALGIDDTNKDGYTVEKNGSQINFKITNKDVNLIPIIFEIKR
jgi:hypothetical protein